MSTDPMDARFCPIEETDVFEMGDEPGACAAWECAPCNESSGLKYGSRPEALAGLSRHQARQGCAADLPVAASTVPAVPDEEDSRPHCPRCDSPNPKLHPAVQAEGEVHICPNPFHAAVPDEVSR